jgi:septal ring factor EnvC (AmiA/AmiB activator)
MKRIATLLLSLFLPAVAAMGQQTVEQLQQQIAEAEADIRATDALLSKTEADRKDNRSQLLLVQKNITNRRQIVTSLDGQIALINRSVGRRSREIGLMEKQLAGLKAEYAVMIRTSYKSQRSRSVLAFLFAAEDFNDVTRRIYYVKRYTAIREHKAVQIDSITRTLQADRAALTGQRDSLGRTVEVRNAELRKLGDDEQKYRRIDTSLGSRVKQYNQKITAQRKAIEKMESRIEQIIAEEARRAQQAGRTEAEQAAFVRLTGRFDENRGKLPYPVSGGVVIEKFGRHPDPENPKVDRNQKGVLFATERGAQVRAVFDGEVVQVFLTPGAGNTVMIRHGSYFTTYSNLETVAVRVGESVTTNQTLGRVYSGDNAENYILPFTLWNGIQPLDPELWIKR